MSRGFKKQNFDFLRLHLFVARRERSHMLPPAAIFLIKFHAFLDTFRNSRHVGQRSILPRSSIHHFLIAQALEHRS